MKKDNNWARLLAGCVANEVRSSGTLAVDA
jgi:hypothetical protein